ncbi:MAG: S-layer homology domain-containing protein, partial [Clostridia bacterium]|nr:S-layer homology domain-containing protein [Clostridia bacterium]
VSLALPSGKRQSVFADEGQIGAYAKSAVAVIADAGLISGYPDGAFRPQGSASRAETAKILVGFLEILEEG